MFPSSGSTTATKVWGQGGSFTSNTQNLNGLSASSLAGVTAVLTDAAANIYISDCLNNRILLYPPGSTAATRVWGQNGPDFDATSRFIALESSVAPLLGTYSAEVTNAMTTNGVNQGGVTMTSGNYPYGSAVDPSTGGLYFAQYGNHRILYFPPGSGIATRVYGQQGSYTTNTGNAGGLSATSFLGPVNCIVDSTGHLFVADLSNARVLYFGNLGSTTATFAYGQPNLVSSTAAVTQTGLTCPYGLALTPSGGLYGE
jgi:hypothetical protein